MPHYRLNRYSVTKSKDLIRFLFTTKEKEEDQKDGSSGRFFKLLSNVLAINTFNDYNKFFFKIANGICKIKRVYKNLFVHCIYCTVISSA